MFFKVIFSALYISFHHIFYLNIFFSMSSQAVIVSNGTFKAAGTTRSVTVKQNDTNTRQIISWLSEQDRESVCHNLDEWNKENKQHTAEKMLRATGLANKADVDKKKACNKIKSTVVERVMFRNSY